MEETNKTYEKTFEDGTEITDYLAVAYAEGFCEGENATLIDTYKAWSYICGKKLYLGLQGFFGRTVRDLIEAKVLDKNGIVDWTTIKKKQNNN